MAEEAADALEEVLSIPRVPPMGYLTGWEFESIREHPRTKALIDQYGLVPGSGPTSPRD
jgi:hypothetical protein